MKKLHHLILFTILLTACSTGQSASRYEDKVVFFGRVFTEETYSYTEYPLPETDIVIVADQLNVIWARLTDIYFWPLTNDWKTEIKTKNTPVDGTLLILQKGNIIQTVDLSNYVVQIDQKQPPKIYFGDEADEAYQEFNQEFENYRNRLNEYQKAYSQYQAEVSAALVKAQETGVPVNPDSLPTEPKKPAEFTRLSSVPTLAFPINLPSGEYDIQLVDSNGQVIPGSKRRLIAIAPLQSRITYKVIPQDQWTKPMRSHRVEDSIYLKPEGVIYLSPEITHEYNLNEWQRVKNPQRPYLSGDERIWVPTGEKIPSVQLWTSANLMIEQLDYWVTQNHGNALGYTISPKLSLDTRSPDFSAFQIASLKEDTTLRIALVSADGTVRGSERKIISVHSPDLQPFTWVVSIVPVLVAVGMQQMRKSSNRKLVSQIST